LARACRRPCVFIQVLLLPGHRLAMSLREKCLLTCGFAFAAGWSDVICFARYGSFAALMTGNTIKAGIAAATKSEQRFENMVYYLCILICYIVGGVVFQAVKARWPRRVGVLSAPVCLSLFILSEVLNQIVGNNKWQVCILAPTFGIQNSLTFGGGLQTNTTIITGNMQKLSLALYQVLACKVTKANLVAIATPAAAVLSTFMASIIGAVILMDVAKLNAAWLFVPAGLLQASMVVVHDKMFFQWSTPAVDQRALATDSSLQVACEASGLKTEDEGQRAEHTRPRYFLRCPAW